MLNKKINFKLEKSFFDKNTLDIAEELIGKVFVYESPLGIIKGIINETEAYREDDQSCHAYNGRKTKKNAAMFLRSGHLYVYFTYGMYYCVNIVTGKKDVGEAVLIRSVIPIQGEDIMRKNRKWNKKQVKGLCDGPAKFCMAYGLDKKFNGYDLLDENSKIYIEDLNYNVNNIEKNQRIGISKDKHLEWRFYCNEKDIVF
ncbi:MAG: DNA-3-methyladenine glycosylase [Nanoarchaeota archaeon]